MFATTLDETTTALLNEVADFDGCDVIDEQAADDARFDMLCDGFLTSEDI